MYHITLQQVSSLPIPCTSDNRSAWIAVFLGRCSGCVAPTVQGAIGCLIRYELSTSLRDDPRFALSKQELLEQFPSFTSDPEEEIDLGQFCIDNADRLGLLLSVHEEEVKVVSRQLLASDSA